MTELIDVNVSLFSYPTRRLPRDDTRALVDFLTSKQVAQAWAGSFEGLLHNDVAGVNERLSDACRQADNKSLVPFGTVNPALPDWEEDLRRCHEVHHMPGIRLYPNYHGYTLDAPNVISLLKQADDRKRIVQIAVRVEDPRTQHRLLNVPDVDLKPLVAILEQHPQLRVVILNGLMSLGADLQSRLVQAGQVFFDIAALEGIGGISRLLKTVPVDRVLFGSHAPFFVWESAELKLMESPLPEPFLERIRRTNAVNLLSAR